MLLMSASQRGMYTPAKTLHMQQMANADRNRVVHAKGSGAYGEFKVTHDVTNYTSLAFLD